MSRSLLLATAAATAACALAAAAEGATYRVEQRAGRIYSPATLTIDVGDTVTWVNADTMPHTTTSGSGSPSGLFDSGNMAPGATFSYTFGAAGSFPYFCLYHSGMDGLITVVDAAVTVQQLAGRIFSPGTVTIDVGQTVLWVNADTMPHTTTSGTGSPSGLFDSGNMGPGSSFAYTFTTAGTVPYYCEYHSGMTGTVIVRPAAAGTIVIAATKSTADLVLRWTAAGGPFTAHRGTSSDLADLAPLPGPVTSPFTDPQAIQASPRLYVYQIR